MDFTGNQRVLKIVVDSGFVMEEFYKKPPKIETVSKGWYGYTNRDKEGNYKGVIENKRLMKTIKVLETVNHDYRTQLSLIRGVANTNPITGLPDFVPLTGLPDFDPTR